MSGKSFGHDYCNVAGLFCQIAARWPKQNENMVAQGRDSRLTVAKAWLNNLKNQILPLVSFHYNTKQYGI